MPSILICYILPYFTYIRAIFVAKGKLGVQLLMRFQQKKSVIISPSPWGPSNFRKTSQNTRPSWTRESDSCIPRKIKMEQNNGGLKDDFPFQTGDFSDIFRFHVN